MSWLQKCSTMLAGWFTSEPPCAVTEPPPSQPDKAPTDKEKGNDQQQQQAPEKRPPLSALQHDY